MVARRGLDRAAERPSGPPPASTFLRGLTLGALVGAAVAGSLLLGRRRGLAPKAAELPARDREREPARGGWS